MKRVLLLSLLLTAIATLAVESAARSQDTLGFEVSIWGIEVPVTDVDRAVAYYTDQQRQWTCQKTVPGNLGTRLTGSRAGVAVLTRISHHMSESWSFGEN